MGAAVNMYMTDVLHGTETVVFFNVKVDKTAKYYVCPRRHYMKNIEIRVLQFLVFSIFYSLVFTTERKKKIVPNLNIYKTRMCP